jgi:hypothetical protein
MAWQLTETLIDRRSALVGLGLAAFAPLGCLGKNFTPDKPAEVAAAPPPAATPMTPKGRLVSTWDKKISYAGDVLRGGSEMAGLVCRFYLLGPDMSKPYFGDGELIVDLYDSTPRGPNTEPILTDELRLSANDLRQFAKSDGMFGDGYTIFMPWTHYSPDAKRVFINMLYTSAKGEKFFDSSGQIVIDHAETTARIQRGMPLSKGTAGIPELLPVSAQTAR